MSLVLDASSALNWFDKVSIAPKVGDLLDRVIQTGAWVPSLWKLEVANALHFSALHGSRDAGFVAMSLADLETLPINIDGETDARAWNDTLRLARQHKLTLYDAAYLELALRRGLPLASLDRELRAAAAAEKVGLLGMNEAG